MSLFKPPTSAAPPAQQSPPPDSVAAGSPAEPPKIATPTPTPTPTDITDRKRRTVQADLQRLAMEYTDTAGEAPSTEWINSRIKELSERELGAFKQKAIDEGRVFQDADPDGSGLIIKRDAERSHEGFGSLPPAEFIRGLPSYGKALLHGDQSVVITPDGVEEIGDVGVGGNLNYLLRGLAGPLAATRLQTGRALGEKDPLGESLFNPVSNLRAIQAFGGPEHVDMLMRGEDEIDALMDPEAKSVGVIEQVIYAPTLVPRGLNYLADSVGVPEWLRIPHAEIGPQSRMVTAVAITMLDPDVLMAAGPLVGAIRGASKYADLTAALSKSKTGREFQKLAGWNGLGRTMDKRDAIAEAAEKARTLREDAGTLREAYAAEGAAKGVDRSLSLQAARESAVSEVVKILRDADESVAQVFRWAVANRFGENLDIAMKTGLSSRFGRAATDAMEYRKALTGRLQKMAGMLSPEALRELEWGREMLSRAAIKARLEDTRATLDAMRRMSPKTARTWAKTVDEGTETVQFLTREIQDLQARLVTEPENLEALTNQIKQIARTREQVMTNLPEVAYQEQMALLTEHLTELERLHGASVKRSEGLYKSMKKDGTLPDEAKKYMDEYAKTEKQMEKMRKLWADDAMHEAVRGALEDMGKSYDSLIARFGEVEPDDMAAALAIQERITSDVMRHIRPLNSPSWFASQVYSILENFARPAVRRLGTNSKEVIDSIADSKGIVNGVKHDLADLYGKAMKAEDPEAALVAAITDWMHGDGGLIKGARDSSKPGEFSPLSNFDAAIRMLRAEAFKGDNDAKTKAMEAIARMWLSATTEAKALHKSGDLYNTLMHILKTGTRATSKKAVAAADPDALTFPMLMEEMRLATIEKMWGSRPADAQLIAKLAAEEIAPQTKKAHTIAMLALGTSLANYRLYGSLIRKSAEIVAGPEAHRAAELLYDLKFAEVEDFTDGLRLVNALGTSALHKKIPKMFGNEQILGLRALSDPVSGEDFFIYRRAADEIDQQIGRIVKSIDPFSPMAADQELGFLLNAMAGIGRLVSTAVLTGLVLPRATYFTANFLNDLSNVYTQRGIREGLAVTKEAGKASLGYLGGLAGQVPYFGPKMQRAWGKYLPTTMQTFFDVDTNVLHRGDFVWSDKFANTGYNFGEVYDVWSGMGVATSGARGMELKTAMRARGTHTALEKVLVKIGAPANAWADVADALDMRRRTAQYVHLIRDRGYNPEAAAAAVKDTLFDWNSAVSEFEATIVQRLTLFWAFQRRALEFGIRNFASAFTPNRAFNGDLKGYMLGEWTPGGRTYATMKAQDALRGASDAQAEDEEDALLRGVDPWWAQDNARKFFLWNVPRDADDIHHSYQEYGRKASYEAVGIPNVTSVDAVQTIGMIITGAAGLALEGDGRDLWGPLADFMGPVLGEQTLDFLDLHDTPDWSKEKGMKLYSPSDRKVARWMGLSYRDGNGPVWRVKPEKMWHFWLLDRLILHNLSTYIDPVVYAGDDFDQQEYLRGMGYLVGRWSGWFVPYQHSPEKTIEFADQDAARARKLREGY